jgi:hypothetical protein
MIEVKRIRVGKEGDLIRFKLEGCEQSYWCTIEQWRVYEMMQEIKQLYGVPAERLDDLEDAILENFRKDESFQD